MKSATDIKLAIGSIAHLLKSKYRYGITKTIRDLNVKLRRLRITAGVWI